MRVPASVTVDPAWLVTMGHGDYATANTFMVLRTFQVSGSTFYELHVPWQTDPWPVAPWRIIHASTPRDS